jgi:hypothetical protein
MSTTQYKLVHTLGNTIHTGTIQECQLILKGLTTYGVREDKFEIVEFETESFLSETTRDKVIERLCDIEMNSFEDGMDRDVIYNGATFPGLNNQSDEELLETLESYVETDDELLVEALGQKATHDMLKESVG